MPRAGRRDREVFTGWIAGLGTDSGHRVVIGHWPRSPYGVVTDAMVQDPAGHRTLYAPTAQLANFLAAAYRFDEVRVAPCGARRSGPGWTVEAGSMRVSFSVGRRPLLGWLLWVLPAPLTRTPWWVGLLDVAARPVGFGFGSVPSRPSLVHLTTIIEAVSPGPGGDGPGCSRGWPGG